MKCKNPLNTSTEFYYSHIFQEKKNVYMALKYTVFCTSSIMYQLNNVKEILKLRFNFQIGIGA